MAGYVCQLCGKPATCHYKQIINGVVKELHYCQECATNAGNSPFQSNIFGVMLGNSTQKKRERVCECGTREHDVIQNYKFGCDKCYGVFEDIVKEFVENLGGGIHKGKCPVAIANHKRVLTERERLQFDLDRAVREERYSDADRIFQQIKVIDEEGGNANNG